MKKILIFLLLLSTTLSSFASNGDPIKQKGDPVKQKPTSTTESQCPNNIDHSKVLSCPCSTGDLELAIANCLNLLVSCVHYVDPTHFTIYCTQYSGTLNVHVQYGCCVGCPDCCHRFSVYDDLDDGFLCSGQIDCDP